MWSTETWFLLMTICNAQTGGCEHAVVPGFETRRVCYEAAAPISKTLKFAKQTGVDFRVTVECVSVPLRES